MASGISERIKLVSALDYASGTATRNGAVADMRGWDGIMAIYKFATIAAGATARVKWQQGETSNLSDGADLVDTEIVADSDDDNQIFALDLFMPNERYVRTVVVKDGSLASAESAVYLLYGPRTYPTTLNVTDLVTAEQHNTPDEGKA